MESIITVERELSGRTLLQMSQDLMPRVAVFTSCGRIRACHIGEPIRFPCAIVIRKSLLPVDMVVIGLSPDNPNFYRLAIVNVLAEKSALRTVKPAKHCCIDLPGFSADVVNLPLPLL